MNVELFLKILFSSWKGNNIASIILGTYGITEDKTQVSEDYSVTFLLWKAEVHSSIFVEVAAIKTDLLIH